MCASLRSGAQFLKEFRATLGAPGPFILYVGIRFLSSLRFRACFELGVEIVCGCLSWRAYQGRLASGCDDNFQAPFCSLMLSFPDTLHLKPNLNRGLENGLAGGGWRLRGPKIQQRSFLLLLAALAGHRKWCRREA